VTYLAHSSAQIRSCPCTAIGRFCVDCGCCILKYGFDLTPRQFGPIMMRFTLVLSVSPATMFVFWLCGGTVHVDTGSIHSGQFSINARLWTIPVEDSIYGFSLTTLTFVLWEWFRRKESDGTEGRG
jgi:hypothetical protein